MDRGADEAAGQDGHAGGPSAVDQDEGGQEGMATEKATTQMLADGSSDAAVRNGWTRTTPIPISRRRAERLRRNYPRGSGYRKLPS
jgi:hypothetical protein